MNLELLILEGPQAGRRLSVGTGALTFGRSANAEVSLPWDNFISGTHLSVQADPVGVLVTDLHSTNGTFLNGQRIAKAVANVGDTIKIGAMAMQVVMAQQQNAPVLSAAMRSPSAQPPATMPTPMGGGATTMIPVMPLPPMNIPEPPSFIPAPNAATTLVQMPELAEFRAAAAQATETKSDKPEDEALRILKEQQPSLFCLLNAGEDESLPSTLLFSGVGLGEHCLLEPNGSEPVPSWAPYLVPLSSRDDLLSSLVRNGWGKGWSCFFTTSASFEDLKAHFGKFLKVQVDRGGEVYFRFYDPRVLRGFLPVANSNERNVFFGPVTEWLLEDDDRAKMLRAKNSDDGLVADRVSLL